jgi:Uma2 family endonuclease
MIPERTPLKLTYEDYLHLPEDGKRHELIDGEHYVTPAPIPGHQSIVVNLLRILTSFVHEHRLGRVFTAPVDIVLSEVDVVQPDVLFVARERLDLVTEKNLRGAPDLVVEVLSDSTRRTDEITKRHLYDRYGVAEYWIVDPVLETVKVYRRAEEGLARRHELSLERGETLTSPRLPGLEIPLAEIFE